MRGTSSSEYKTTMRSVVASAPGSLMLMGEHAVLHGRRSLVCAVDRRLTVEARLRSDRRVVMTSSLGNVETSLDHCGELPDRFRFLRSVLKGAGSLLPCGMDVRVESQLDSTLGLGSSAAFTVALLAAVHALSGGGGDPKIVIREARSAIRDAQGGFGSGADAAAAVLGGVVAYRAEPLNARRLAHTFPIVVVYSGAKLPTAEVIQRVEQARRTDPVLFERIFDAMDATAAAAEEAIAANHPRQLGALLNAGQGLMEAVGVVHAPLEEIVRMLRADPGIVGAKVSGSGLGDCVIGLGHGTATVKNYPVVETAMSPRGLECAGGA